MHVIFRKLVIHAIKKIVYQAQFNKSDTKFNQELGS